MPTRVEVVLEALGFLVPSDLEALRGELDEVQEQIDVASLNVLYRLRLQLEKDDARRISHGE